MHCLKAFHNRARPPNAGSVITHRCNYMVKHHWDSSLDLWCKLIFFVTFYLRLISFVIFIFHGWRFFFILLTRERMSRVCISVREKTRLCPEPRTYLDMGWCYTPGTPAQVPHRSAPRTSALGCCRSSSDCVSLGCSLCCTETRNSRWTNHRWPCGQTSSRDAAPHLIKDKKID